MQNNELVNTPHLDAHIQRSAEASAVRVEAAPPEIVEDPSRGQVIETTGIEKVPEFAFAGETNTYAPTDKPALVDDGWEPVEGEHYQAVDRSQRKDNSQRPAALRKSAAAGLAVVSVAVPAGAIGTTGESETASGRQDQPVVVEVGEFAAHENPATQQRELMVAHDANPSQADIEAMAPGRSHGAEERTARNKSTVGAAPVNVEEDFSDVVTRGETSAADAAAKQDVAAQGHFSQASLVKSGVAPEGSSANVGIDDAEGVPENWREDAHPNSETYLGELSVNRAVEYAQMLLSSLDSLGSNQVSWSLDMTGPETAKYYFTHPEFQIEVTGAFDAAVGKLIQDATADLGGFEEIKLDHRDTGSVTIHKSGEQGDLPGMMTQTKDGRAYTNDPVRFPGVATDELATAWTAELISGQVGHKVYNLILVAPDTPVK